MAVFGGVLGIHDLEVSAVDQVLAEGLPSLARHWVLTDPANGSEQIVCIQQASPGSVTLALDYYSMPGVPTLEISRSQLDSGEWQLDIHG